MYEISINKPRKIAKIHKRNCPQIKKIRSDGTQNQQYISCNTLEEACQYIKEHFSNYREKGCCQYCIKNPCPC